MPDQATIALFHRYHTGTASAAETQLWKEQLLALSDADIAELLETEWNGLKTPDSRFANYRKEEMWAEIMKVKQVQAVPVRRLGWTRYAAAAALLVAIATAWLLTRPANPVLLSQAQRFKNDVAPGHNGAVLTLSNGQQITLDSANNGTLAVQGSIQVVKENGEISYAGKGGEVVYNDVKTDKGRQWQLTLSDGTKVWLNAASSIHYPNTFSGNERVVEIRGEAYFEVAHNAKQPFRVKAGNQTIEDIGTAFDVNAYSDEPAVTTTLVEGQVKINNTLLKPGQQYANGKVEEADVETATAWKNGNFQFGRADITTVMKDIARWYDVEVIYKGNVKDHFGGTISREVNVSKVFEMLEMTGAVKFTIDGKKITVLNARPE